MKRLICGAGILASDDCGFKYIENGYLGIDGETIDYIGTKKPTGYDEEKDMAGTMLIPGLINTHTHSPMTLLRGVGSGLTLQSWLFDVIFPLEDKLTADDCRVGAELAMMEMLAGGTTSFSDMYMDLYTVAEAAIRAGIKANLGRTVQCFDPDEDIKDTYRIWEAVDLYDKYHNSANGRIKVDFSIHAEYTCTEFAARYFSNICREHDGIMHIHLSETEKEHRECIEKNGKTPAEWFNSVGAFDSRCFCAHCVHVTDDDIALMAKKNVAVVHNPTSNMKLGSGFAPIRKMLDAGICVGLGTDGAASNNDLDMIEEMHIASVIHNGYTGDAALIKPEEVLRMATVNGARIQGRYDTGEIKVGKKADIAALSLAAPHMHPNLDPVALVCYSAKASDVCMTMVDGRILYENGKWLTMDARRIFAEVDEIVKRICG